MPSVIDEITTVVLTDMIAIADRNCATTQKQKV